MLIVPDMSKPYTSKSVQHLGTYGYVKQLHDYILSYKYVQIFHTYALALVNFAHDKVVAKSPLLTNLLTYLDAQVDSLLSTFDNVSEKLLNTDLAKSTQAYAQAWIKSGSDLAGAVKARGLSVYDAVQAKVQPIIAPYQKKAAQVNDAVGSYVNAAKSQGKAAASQALKPVNDTASAVVDKYLPKSKKVAKETEAAAEDEIAKSVEILSDTYERSKDLLTSKSSEVSNAVTSTYRKEFDATADGNYYVKVASASVNTGVSLLKNANAEYLQPLKDSSQKYVAETVSKTQDVAAKKSAEAKDVAQSVNRDLNKASNGAIPIATN